jgi:hypothetical protein
VTAHAFERDCVPRTQSWLAGGQPKLERWNKFSMTIEICDGKRTLNRSFCSPRQVALSFSPRPVQEAMHESCQAAAR